MSREEEDRFIESWGSMGILWGINRSMARIQALLFTMDKPVDLDQVAQRLNISRGNVSMCLKELRNWGVIQRVHISGDRRDFYEVEPDVWRMFFLIAVERKKREFDPAFHALKHLIAEADADQKPTVRNRMLEMERLLSTIDKFMSRTLASEEKSRTMLGFFTGLLPE